MDRSTLNKATSADDTPTPGYLCTEIAQATFVDVTACQTLADYLLKKLERDNPHVKAKVLRLVRFVCDNGKADFRRTMQRKADVVKACLQYRGQPDPLKGDALNKAVREAADAAVKSIFSADTATNAYGVSANAKKLQSFGSEEKDDLSSHIGTLGPKPGGGGGGSSFSSSNFPGAGGMGMGMGGPKSFGSSGMVGFGNDPSDIPGANQSDTMFKQAMSSTLSAVSKLTSMVPGMNQGDKSYTEPPGSSTGNYRAPPAMPSMGSSGPWGGGAAAGGFGSTSGSGSAAPARTSATAGRSSGDYEARVVAEICTPGGARVAPSQAALQEFVQKCESLDAGAVGEQLGQRLASADWQTKAKALYAVESLAQNNLDGIVGHVSQCYSAQLFEAQKLPQCQQKASRVLVLLGLMQEDELPRASAPVAAGSVAAAASAPVTDLLDFDDSAPASAGLADAGAGAGLVGGSMDLLEEPAPASAPGPSAVASSAAGGLFGSLSMKNEAPEAAAAPLGQPSLLATLDAQAAVPPPSGQAGLQPAAQSSGPGLFAGLSMDSAPASAASVSGMLGSPVPSGQMSAFPGLSGSQSQMPLQPQMGMQQQAQTPVPANPALGGMQASQMYAPPAPCGFAGAAAGGMAGGLQGMSSGSNASSAFGFISPGQSSAAQPPLQGMAPQGMMQPGMMPAMQMQGVLQPIMQPGMQPSMQPSMQMGMQPGILQGMQPAMPSSMPGAMGGMGAAMPPMSMPPPGSMLGPVSPAPSGTPSKEQPQKDNAFGFVSEQMRLHVEQSSSPAPGVECH